MPSTLRLIPLLLVTLLFAPPTFAADTPLQRAKAFYGDAAYDLALKELEAVDMTTQAAVEALEYRTLCYLALERPSEAERAAEALVLTAPNRTVTGDLPPRYVTLITETRRRLLPGILARTLAQARELYQQSRVAPARVTFQGVLALAADPLLADMPEVADMRVVASGFLDLLRDQRAEREVQPVVVPPRPIRQALPAWEGADASTAHDATGRVRVVISADGTVTSATVERPIHPSYDPVLLEAARGWLYEPATFDGKPVESEKVIDIQFPAPLKASK